MAIPVFDIKATSARLQAICGNFKELSAHRDGLLSNLRNDVEKVQQYCAEIGWGVPEGEDVQRLISSLDTLCALLLQIAERIHRFADDVSTRTRHLDGAPFHRDLLRQEGENPCDRSVRAS
ncbi:hypothetical protein Q3C01_03515 [Bradyrhizobium sp. UFLA05-109]